MAARRRPRHDRQSRIDDYEKRAMNDRRMFAVNRLFFSYPRLYPAVHVLFLHIGDLSAKLGSG
jgi:hypothetical protein